MKVVISNSKGGFSLVESLIVLAIAAILVTLSFGYLISARPHAQLEEAEMTVAALMTKARNLAVSEEINTRVVFDADSQQFQFERHNRVTDEWTAVGSVTTLPDGVTVPAEGITFPGGTTIQFTPRGTLLAGGSITMESQSGESTTLQGSLVTGRFNLQGGHLR